MRRPGVKLAVRTEVNPMRSTQVAEASCLYCADVLIPDEPACEECARIEPRIMWKLRARTLDSPVHFCTAVVSLGTGLVCSACDEAIVDRQRNYLGVEPSPKRLLRMHPRCARVWQVLGRPALLQS